MSIYDHIKESLIKQNKILQVDYLGQKIIENHRDNFQEWQHINPITQKQKKLWQYLQKENLHQQKYFRFKKTLNHKHFGLDLPQEYKHSTILDPNQDNDLLYSPRKMVSSVLGNSTMDTSGGHFMTSIDTIKQDRKKFQSRASTSFNQRSNVKQRQRIITSYKKQKNFSRYWPLQDNQSITFKQKNSVNLIRSRKPKQDRSIFNQSVNRSIKRSFDTIKSRPLSQQMQRHTDQVKDLVQKTINPEVHKQNIRQTLRSMTEKHKITERKVKKQRESILDTITNKQELMKFLRQSRSIDPKRKGIFTIEDLTEFEKFNLSFPKYMRLKSLKKINNYAYQNKVKQKSGNLQKFQNFILQQFGIQSDNKRKLQKIFEQIVWQFGRSQRRKQAQRR